ncbi:hypothetical protein D3C80_1604710 [compost metagenome]
MRCRSVLSIFEPIIYTKLLSAACASSPRPIISIFKFVMVFFKGKTGFSEYQSEPHSPLSSPVTVINKILLLGPFPAFFAFIKASAIIITPVVPEPSSSAPLLILSSPGALASIPI